MRITKISNTVAALILIALVSSLAFAQTVVQQPGAQQPQSTKGAVVKGKAPVNKNVLKVLLKAVAILSNQKFKSALAAALFDTIALCLKSSHSSGKILLPVLSMNLSDTLPEYFACIYINVGTSLFRSLR